MKRGSDDITVKLFRCLLNVDFSTGKLECNMSGAYCLKCKDVQYYTGPVMDDDGCFYNLKNGLLHNLEGLAMSSKGIDFYFVDGKIVGASFDDLCDYLKEHMPKEWVKLMARSLGSRGN